MKQAFQRWYPASLTKIMTAYLAFQGGQIRPDEHGDPGDHVCPRGEGTAEQDVLQARRTVSRSILRSSI
jgi:D-alanyl-D-alanine carboxypeptidase